MSEAAVTAQRSQVIANSPGGLLLQRLIKLEVDDGYALTDDDWNALRQLGTEFIELDQFVEFIENIDGRLLKGTELARIVGLSVSGNDCGCLFIEMGFGPTKAILKTEDEIISRFDEIRGKLKRKFSLKIERIIWGEWVNRSGWDEARKVRLRLLLPKLAEAVLWGIKAEFRVSELFEIASLERVSTVFESVPDCPSPRYLAELRSVVAQLKAHLPDFEAEDLLFGASYELVDPVATKQFQSLYLKALLILMSKDSSCDDTFDKFIEVFQRAKEDLMSALSEANCECDFQKFTEAWNKVFYALPSMLHFDEHVLKFHLFKNDLKNRSFVKSLVTQIHGNIRDYAGFSLLAGSKRAEMPRKTFRACYSAFFQTSGSGKTKNMIGMGEFALLFYICVRPDNTTGYPPRSIIYDLISQFVCGTDFVFFFYALFDVFLEWINDTDKLEGVYAEHDTLWDHRNFFKSFSLLLADPSTALHRDFWAAVKEKTTASRDSQEYKSVYAHERDNLMAIESNRTPLLEVKVFATSVTEKFASKMAAIVAKCLSLPGANPFPNEPQIPIIFAFDEARNLLKDQCQYLGSLFRMLRHVCVMFEKNGYMLFADTTSRTSNFVYPSSHDPSPRPPKPGSELFAPFMYLPAMNVLKVSWPLSGIAYLEVQAKSTDWKTLKYDLLDCVSSGRPLFVVTCNADPAEPPVVRFKNCVSYALTRFFPGNEQPVCLATNAKKGPICRAAASCLLDMSFVELDINDELVSSYLAFSTNLSSDRRFLSARYLPEAVVQEAAAWIHRADKKEFLRQLAWDVKHGLPLECDQGLKGEVVAAYLLLPAKFHRDDQSDRFYAEPCTVHDFFTGLYNGDESVLSRLPESIANSYIAFNAARRCNKTITKELLLNAWRRRVLIYCKRNATSVDLAIPIVMGSKEGEFVEPSIRSISGIMIQVKNNADTLKVEILWPPSLKNLIPTIHWIV